MGSTYSLQELTNKLTVHIQELARETDIASISGAMAVYLKMCARFN